MPGELGTHGGRVDLRGLSAAKRGGRHVAGVARVHPSFVSRRAVELRNVQLERIDFSRAVLPDARFLSADLRDCVFDFAVLEGADVDRSTIRDCSFLRTNLRDACLAVNFAETAVWEGVAFVQTDLRAAFSHGGSMSNVRFEDAKLDRYVFANTALANVAFEGRLLGVEFDSRYGEKRQRPTVLRALDFSRAQLHDVVFFGCRLDDPVLPKGQHALRIERYPSVFGQVLRDLGDRDDGPARVVRAVLSRGVRSAP